MKETVVINAAEKPALYPFLPEMRQSLFYFPFKPVPRTSFVNNAYHQIYAYAFNFLQVILSFVTDNTICCNKQYNEDHLT